MFERIAHRYDLLNHLLSAGRDVHWRRFTAKMLPPDVRTVIDVATGTGDLAAAVARELPRVWVVGVDFAREMLAMARDKATPAHRSRISLVEGDATNLPFDAGRFDAACIGFGFRNIPDRRGALLEMKRVVRPGGTVSVLEMTFPKTLERRRLFQWYLDHFIPAVGGLLSGDRAAYRYLPDSIRGFLEPREMRRLFTEVGLVEVREYALTFGLTYLHRGTVP